MGKMSRYRAPAYLNKNVCAYSRDSAPKAEAQPAKSVNVKMPKLIAMAVPRIRHQKADPAILPAPGAKPLPTFGAPQRGGFWVEVKGGISQNTEGGYFIEFNNRERLQ